MRCVGYYWLVGRADLLLDNDSNVGAIMPRIGCYVDLCALATTLMRFATLPHSPFSKPNHAPLS